MPYQTTTHANLFPSAAQTPEPDGCAMKQAALRALPDGAVRVSHADDDHLLMTGVKRKRASLPLAATIWSLIGTRSSKLSMSVASESKNL